MRNSSFNLVRVAGGAVVAVCVFAFTTALPVGAKDTTTESPSNGDLDLARRLEAAFVKVAEQTSASVVVITSTHSIARSEETESLDDEGLKQFEGTPFEYFFRRRGMPPTHPRDIDSEGSGIIYRADGYIVTNNHVVDGASKIKVRLKDGREFDAEVVGTDDRTDVAVIKVKAKDLPAAKMGNSDGVKVGQWAIAIGAPYELDYSFTVGFVSAKGRSAVWSRGGSAYEDYIQTDAAINPGNSGGPLCDIEGRVIGINTLIRGLNLGIGFAIPVNMFKDVADQLIATGKVIRPWIGITIQALSENKELAEMIKDVKDGVIVQEIHPETPAAKSDLKPADIITAVDNVPVKSPRELQQQILRKKVGQKVTLNVVRDGKKIQLPLQTGQMPDRIAVAARPAPSTPKMASAFGLTVQTLTPELAEKLKLETTEGVVVTEVVEGSVAEQKGLQHGDLITEIDRTPVKTAEQFRKAMNAADPTKGVLVYLKRGDASTFVVLKEAK